MAKIDRQSYEEEFGIDFVTARIRKPVKPDTNSTGSVFSVPEEIDKPRGYSADQPLPNPDPVDSDPIKNEEPFKSIKILVVEDSKTIQFKKLQEEPKTNLVLVKEINLNSDQFRFLLNAILTSNNEINYCINPIKTLKKHTDTKTYSMYFSREIARA